MARPKTYKINEEYFTRNIDERQAYFLGLIMSDGSINYNRGTFNYICKSEDEELLMFIKKELSSTHPIKFFNFKLCGNKYKRYSITNKKLIQSLIKKFNLPYGNKSINNLIIPENIPSNMIHHFLRGFFDGDGSIWFGGGTYRASYTGGENMMLSIKDVINKLNIPTYISYRYSKENKNSCNLTINGTLHTEKFGKFLYKNSTCYLKRKFDRFCKCYVQSKYIQNKSLLLSGNEEKIKQMYINKISQSNIAKHLNLIPSSVRCCVQRLRRQNVFI